MAIQFNSMAKTHFAGAFMKSWYNNGNYTTAPSGGFGMAMTVHSGAQPTADNFITNWTSYSSGNANFLAYYSNLSWYHSNYASSTGNLLQMGIPTAVTPTNNGVAAWAVLWSPKTGTTIPTLGDMAAGSIPTQLIVIVPVSDILGTGIIRFVNTTLSTSTAVAPFDGSFGVNW